MEVQVLADPHGLPTALELREPALGLVGREPNGLRQITMRPRLPPVGPKERSEAKGGVVQRLRLPNPHPCGLWAVGCRLSPRSRRVSIHNNPPSERVRRRDPPYHEPVAI